MMSRCGAIVDIRLATFPKTGVPRRFGFVQFSSPHEAVRPRRALNHHIAEFTDITAFLTSQHLLTLPHLLTPPRYRSPCQRV